MEHCARINIFADLPGDVYRRAVSKILWKEYAENTKILSHKEESSDIYFIKDGHVRATMYSYSGKEVSYQDLFMGDIFGELSAIDGLPRSTHVVAIKTSQIGSMCRNEFISLIRSYPDVSTRVLASLTTKIRDLTDRVYQCGALDVKDRLRKEILRLAKQNMTGPNSALIAGLPKHVELANRINTHREAVTRELNALFRLGLIQQDQRILAVNDVDKLAALVPEV